MMRKKKLMHIAMVFFSASAFSQSVGINTATPDAILDIVSTKSGVLLPRLSQLQMSAIAAPNEGELVWVSDQKCYKYYTGGEWRFITFCTSGGNPPPAAETAGKVGIGTADPKTILDIAYKNGGILLPRFANPLISVTTPKTSELLWNTTANCHQYFTDGIWKNLTNCN